MPVSPRRCPLVPVQHDRSVASHNARNDPAVHLSVTSVAPQAKEGEGLVQVDEESSTSASAAVTSAVGAGRWTPRCEERAPAPRHEEQVAPDAARPPIASSPASRLVTRFIA